MNNKMSTKEQLLAVFLVFPLSFILSGLVIRYGWNNILTTLDGVPSITLAQAIGLDILVSYIIVSGGRKENDYDFGELLSKVIGTPIITFVLLWLVTLFL
ncbi:hypothetical protein NOL13_11550 [Streptococcus suis]|uniref:Phage membrane protein n=2 Tax=Streptococcus suis TaxID=1307 RepID=A0A9X4RT66_STRSU|nr:hypothetical protein [Streptococcus suis]MBY5026863.1 hypothetical protein [Streptococcus suis]MDG4528012.1 hypothetical protein [Streptococcus suis]MDG4530409.1 hypothetical protein [Streptococcus suis]QZT17898.1 hypothetical protein K6974_02460 [Streptococcus suis]